MFFAYWLLNTFLPVLWIESKYQVQRFLRDELQITSVRDVFFPHISLDFRGYRSQNRENGIYVPKIFVDEPVIYNVDPNNREQYIAALKQGIAHASSTRFPDEGGLGYYFAHSTYPELRDQYNAVFYLLGKLEKGDEIFIWHEGKRFEYRVTEVRTTAPDETDFLYQDYAQETIVLQTCWPPGTTIQRKLVFAERVNERVSSR